MPNRQFSERLNRELDNIGVPPETHERIAIFAKLLKIPRFKAASLLEGVYNPDEQLLKALADELEVSIDWLVGKNESKAKEH